MQAYADGFRMLEGETLDGLLAAYDEVAAATDALVLTASTSTPASRCPPRRGSSPARRGAPAGASLHIVAETAQHAGHADIIRETIDGQKSMG